ncbi:hypothetical protein [Apilactobacillus xinyiensis]|uniref:hypothetical protein n=1 Tax=Apilactobacillus xinyiensis TaxID=2841032 RepID=UPI00200C739B|nr:hypothetical protein [Apilactobacillus xinyiensis]MCL0330674.1 hypothetical protein [Apilactobacillus xinyiensis]
MKNKYKKIFPQNDDDLLRKTNINTFIFGASILFMFVFLLLAFSILPQSMNRYNKIQAYTSLALILLALLSLIVLIFSTIYFIFLSIYPIYKNHNLKKKNKIDNNRSGNIFGNNNLFNNNNIDKKCFSYITICISKFFFQNSTTYNNLPELKKYISSLNLNINVNEHFMEDIINDLEKGCKKYNNIQKDFKRVLKLFKNIILLVIVYLFLLFASVKFGSILESYKLLFEYKDIIEKIPSILGVSVSSFSIKYIVDSIYDYSLYYRLYGYKKENYNKLVDYLFVLKMQLKYKKEKKIGFR